MNTALKISSSDFQLIFREKTLRSFLIMPFIIIAVTVWGFPVLADSFPIIVDYLVFVLMGSLTQTSILFGFIYSMVLVEEKETGVASVYGVIPINKYRFIISRLIIPFSASFSASVLLLVLQPFCSLTTIDILIISIQCGLVSPFITLIVSIFAKNKMEGMTWFKAVDLLIILPIASFLLINRSTLFFLFYPPFGLLWN